MPSWWYMWSTKSAGVLSLAATPRRTPSAYRTWASPAAFTNLARESLTNMAPVCTLAATSTFLMTRPEAASRTGGASTPGASRTDAFHAAPGSVVVSGETPAASPSLRRDGAGVAFVARDMSPRLPSSTTAPA